MARVGRGGATMPRGAQVYPPVLPTNRLLDSPLLGSMVLAHRLILGAIPDQVVARHGQIYDEFSTVDLAAQLASLLALLA